MGVMLQKMYNWYGKRNVLIVGSIIAVLAVAGIVTKLMSSDEAVVVEDSASTLVKVASVSDLAISDGVTFIGTVRAVSEASIQSEVGGRVTSVRAKAGDTVNAGAVIVTLENASQQAAVLQAQGAYEAALASAAVSDVSVSQAETSLVAAKNSAINSNRTAYSTANDILLNTIDTFFSNPQSGILGLRLEAGSQKGMLNDIRTEFRTAFPAWSTTVNNLTASSDLQGALALSERNTRQLLTLVDSFIAIVADDSENQNLTDAERASYASSLATAKANLNSLLASYNTTATSLSNSEEALRQAQIGGTNPDVSAANAQVKQALGSLRSAQANLAKTILRTPIAGTVNTMSVNVGDFVSGFTPLAQIANNGSLEVSIFLGDNDVANVAIGDTVLIEGDKVGTVVTIAPALDPTTQKIEVKIATDATDLTNGDTVTVSLSGTQATANENGPLLVPITAVKFSATSGTMYGVEDSKLVEIPVELGPVRGSNIIIASGITNTTRFVVDARGLTVGQRVEVVNAN